MAVQFYDYLYQNVGSGRKFYSSLEGEIVLDLYTDIGNELAAANLPPLQEPNPTPVAADDWARIVTCYAFLKIASGLDTLPFVSSPETRYRIGNYSMQVGKQVVVLPDDTIRTIPHYAEPIFIIYAETAIKPFRFIQIKDYDVSVPDEITFADDPNPPTAAEFYYLTSFYFGSNALDNGYGMALNLVEGITAELVVYYTWGSLQLSNAGTVPKIIFPY